MAKVITYRFETLWVVHFMWRALYKYTLLLLFLTWNSNPKIPHPISECLRAVMSKMSRYFNIVRCICASHMCPKVSSRFSCSTSPYVFNLFLFIHSIFIIWIHNFLVIEILRRRKGDIKCHSFKEFSGWHESMNILLQTVYYQSAETLDCIDDLFTAAEAVVIQV